MRIINRAVCVLAVVTLAGGFAGAQTIQLTVRDIALKSGESTEATDLYFINTNCKTLLKATPEAEIMDGPPGVTAVVNPAKVVPHGYGCANPVTGGKLVISAKDIQDYSVTRMVIRVTYKTLDGDRQLTQNYNVTLFPSN